MVHYYAFVCVYFHASNHIYVISDIYVIVIFDMCALYFESFIYVISLVLCLFALLSRFYSDASELYYLYSCLFHIF